jgi:hypothetical protein
MQERRLPLTFVRLAHGDGYTASMILRSCSFQNDLAELFSQG